MAENSRLISAPATLTDSTAGGSSLDTILNVVNIAFGAGMLGLPYAIQGAGFVSGIVGMGIVLYWNFFCCSLLVQLRKEVLQARNNAVKVCNWYSRRVFESALFMTSFERANPLSREMPASAGKKQTCVSMSAPMCVCEYVPCLGVFGCSKKIRAHAVHCCIGGRAAILPNEITAAFSLVRA